MVNSMCCCRVAGLLRGFLCVVPVDAKIKGINEGSVVFRNEPG